MDTIIITNQSTPLDVDLLHKGMAQVEERLIAALEKRPSPVTSMCKEVICSGGKRIRPLLVLTSGLCFGPLNDDIINTAAAVELVHTASLVHDDIIDNSPTRRGKETLSKTWGNQVATLAGDYLFAEAFSIMSQHNLSYSLEQIVNAIQHMCDGEIQQSMDAFNFAVDEEIYFERIYKKTGALITACCTTGAYYNGASGQEIKALMDYGINIGNGFQIIDDILDFTGDSKSVGKPIGADLLGGNITLPVILLQQIDPLGEDVKNLIQKGEATYQNINEINQMLCKSDALSLTFEKARFCIETAKSSINFISPSPFKDILFNIADKIISRNK
jgi:heptaprenyl diphosphate synthase